MFGLYSVLWGKHRENLEIKVGAAAASSDEEIPQPIKPPSQPNNNNNNNNNIANNSIFISMPAPEDPIKPNQIRE